ncbi:MAG: DsbA family protein [Rhodobacteraceae bacterium]|nr:DsbA family protein [Paracoccaceae bacterium]
MTRWITIAVGVIGLAVGAFFVMDRPQLPLNPIGAANAQETPDISQIEDMQIGNPDAPVTVIEYASYTCPHCGRFHTGPYKQLKADYIDTGKINFVYREVYFDRFGLWASAVARCAGPVGFFGITDLLYENQSEWTRAGGGDPTAIVNEIRKIGRVAGLGKDELEACLQDETKLRTLVAWFQHNAEQDNVDSTPTFVINGKKYANMSYDRMSEIIDEAAGS